MASDFDYRFSSEVFDTETGLSYYNYRYYSPELGRWLSRDPIGEDGFSNAFGPALSEKLNPLKKQAKKSYYNFVKNGPVNSIDILALHGVPPGWGISPPSKLPKNFDKAVKKYVEKCKDGACDLDSCLTICNAFYGYVSPILVAKCVCDCQKCALGTFFGNHPPK
jgi:RHS repeat-associated protein